MDDIFEYKYVSKLNIARVGFFCAQVTCIKYVCSSSVRNVYYKVGRRR